MFILSALAKYGCPCLSIHFTVCVKENIILELFGTLKNLRLHNVDILEKFSKDWAFNKKYIAEKDDF